MRAPSFVLFSAVTVVVACRPSAVEQSPVVSISPVPEAAVTPPGATARAPEDANATLVEKMGPLVNEIGEKGRWVDVAPDFCLHCDNTQRGVTYSGGPGRGSLVNIRAEIVVGEYPFDLARHSLFHQGERHLWLLACFERARRDDPAMGVVHVTATLSVNGSGDLVATKMAASGGNERLLACMKLFYRSFGIASPERPPLILRHEIELRPPM